jgi:hypothetical protein
MSEYVDVLLPLLDQKPADAHGDLWSYHGTGAAAPDVVWRHWDRRCCGCAERALRGR